jgi:NitT/TauT family transport system ATP-binding protein
MEDRTALLHLEHVSKVYGRFTALKDIDLTIHTGEFVCLVGPSGCGKSSLLRIITGLSTPSGGRVLYRNLPLAGVNPYSTIVFQSFALFPWLTVQENVEVALQARGLPPAEQRQRSERLLGIVGLDGFESAYPRELSGGMRQKVGFARAMACEPELLCLDEPFSALDVLSAETLRGELLELWLERKIPTQAILMVTHNIEEAVLMADRIIVMAKDPGHITADMPITLRYPRARKDTALMAHVDSIYTAISSGRTGVGALSPGETALPQSQALPPVSLMLIGGLTEAAATLGGRCDLPRLADEIGIGLNEFLPIVEATERLGLAKLEQGDLVLTPQGRTHAEASIPARIELLAGRILRIPLIRWIYEALQNDDNHRIDRGYFIDMMRRDFGHKAEEQLEIAIAWGRFSELFTYDADTRELYLLE